MRVSCTTVRNSSIYKLERHAVEVRIEEFLFWSFFFFFSSSSTCCSNYYFLTAFGRIHKYSLGYLGRYLIYLVSGALRVPNTCSNG